MPCMESHSQPAPAQSSSVPSDPLVALIELRDRMQALHAQLEYTRLLLRLQNRPQA
jgi:hypothetical protein